MNYVNELDKVIGICFTTYKGCIIEHKGGGFVVFNIRYDTLEQAKFYIDQCYKHLKKSIK